MPSTSAAQHRAMEAAVNGNSTLGIPKAVGEEFVAADATNGHAAGVLYVAPDGDVLLLRRSSTEKNYAGHWALPGGKGEDGETPEQTADRETREEMGPLIPESSSRMKLLDCCVTPTGMAFHTFAQAAPEKFVPTLNEEHSGYAWSPMNQLPGPLHPAVQATISGRLGIDELETPEDWAMFNIGLVNWVNSGDDEPFGAQDSIAMDRDSVRRIDQDGHLFVETTPISKAVVNPYYGKEIPGFQKLGLDPERIYNLLRDPDELKAAASTFAGKPLMLIHQPVNSEEHPREIVVGSIGDDVEFKAPYLMAPLNIWDGEAIKLIESGERRELSCGYQYEPVMEAGTYQGERYDGRMTKLRGNHISLVQNGRAGPDVIVGDEALKPAQEADMANKHAASKARKAALTTALSGVLAQDANIEDVVKTLMAIDEDLPKAAAEDEDKDDDDQKAMDDEDADKDKKAEDESEEDDDKKAEDEDEKKDMVSKGAMDAAIRAAVANERKVGREIDAAKEDVRPYVGSISIACDSAADVYGAALKGLNIDVAGVHPSAFKAILKTQPLPGASAVRQSHVTMDAKAVNSFFDRYPEAKSHQVKTL